MDRFTSMSVFVTVVDQGNFSAAAEHLQLSRASTSKHIAALENCLGGRLLNRTTRRISLTEAGQAYYEHCKQILEDVAQAECVVTGYSSEPRGLLRINAPMSFGTKQFADIVAVFCQTYPATSTVFCPLTNCRKSISMRSMRPGNIYQPKCARLSILLSRRLGDSRHGTWAFEHAFPLPV